MTEMIGMSGLAGPSSSCTEPRMPTKLSLSRHDGVQKTVGARLLLFHGDSLSSLKSLRSCAKFRATLRLGIEILPRGDSCGGNGGRNRKAEGVTQRLAESFVLEDVGRGDGDEPKVETEDLGKVIRRAQFSGHVKRRRKEAPNDFLHNLAKAVALRVASENLASDEDVMRVVRDTGLRVEVRSMNMVVWQLGQMQNWHAATKAFRAFRSAGVEPNAYVCTTLIAALG